MAAKTVSDLEYDLMVTIANLLQGREVLGKYARDAEDAGDNETASMLIAIRDYNEEAAHKLRTRLARIIKEA